MLIKRGSSKHVFEISGVGQLGRKEERRGTRQHIPTSKKAFEAVECTGGSGPRPN